MTVRHHVHPVTPQERLILKTVEVLKDGGLGLILLDKVRPSKQLVKDLKEKFPTARTPCFGTASVDMEKDPKLVTFNVNKSIPGMDRRMKKSLKGTGYTKVEIARGDGDDDEA